MTPRPGRTHAERLSALRGLYAIVGDGDPVGMARAAIAGGARVVQVRLKRTAAGEALSAARRIVEAAGERALVIVNDRADLALLADADGVHVGDEDLPPEEARRLLGPDRLVGRTCRTVDEVRAAAAEGADHAGFGPVFASRSKALAVPPRGLAALRAAASSSPVPLVAIGGISVETIGEVAAAGAAAAAVIDDLFARGDVRERAALLADAFDAGAARRGGAP